MTPRERLALLEQMAAAKESGDTEAFNNLRGLLVEGGPSGFDAGEMARNIPGSAMKALQDTLSLFTDFPSTARAVGGLIESGVERLNPFMGPEDYQYQQYPQAVGQAIQERYGGREEALRTLEQDPVGALFDVSGGLTALGAATRLPAVSRVGTAMDPVNLAVNVPKAAIAAGTPKSLPTLLYERAAKFPPGQVKTDVRERATETALHEGIMPTFSGIEKLEHRLGELDVRLNELVNAADASGKTIARNKLYSELGAVRRELSQGADAPRHLAQYNRIVNNLDEMLQAGPEKLTPSRVQKFKTETYKDINWRGSPSTRARNETLKALARGARKAMEDVTPEIADVNRAYGPMAELLENLEQPARRIANRNPLSLLTAGTTGAGFVGAGLPGAVTGAAVGMLNDPRIMARMALSLRNLQDQGVLGAMSGGSTGAQMIRQGLLQSGRLEDFMEEETNGRTIPR